MVGVAAESSNGVELSSKHNPVVKHMLKVREDHARAQKYDYSHVFRRKTRCQMFRAAAIAMSIEFAYAAETSFVSPILLQIGIDHKHMTMAWGLSPLIGFFLSPLLGSFSDRCKLNWGRRRPIITLLSIGILAGLILVPYGKEFGSWLGDPGYNATIPKYNNHNGSDGTAEARSSAVENGPNASDFKFGVILTILGMIVLDFDADTCQTPARTYILDNCIAEEQPRALTTFTLMAGIGGTIGYAIGGIDWEQTQIGGLLGGNIPIVFGIVTIIFVVCYFITIMTFREIPLKLIEQDAMLKPLSAAEIKKELNNRDTIYFIKESTTLELQMAEKESNKMPQLNTAESYQNRELKTIDDQVTNKRKAVESQSDLEDDDAPVTLRRYLKSIFVMPYSMVMLSLTNLFCWMAHLTYCLYFTDFVGEAVFLGKPQGSSEEIQLFDDGVRFGCWGMSIYAFSCSVYSLSVTRLMKSFGAKTVYIAGILYYGIGMLVLALWPTEWGVLVFSTSAGILYGTVFTMPYILLANYHAKNCFRIRNGETVHLKQKRGLGTDVAIISNMVFFAQMIVAFTVGPLIEWMQTTCAVLFASTVLAFIAALCAMFVLYV